MKPAKYLYDSASRIVGFKKFFIPNFITDYKVNVMGMSIKEIDRLHAFRQENKYVNSSEEIQKVTWVSDSLLNDISMSAPNIIGLYIKWGN